MFQIKGTFTVDVVFGDVTVFAQLTYVAVDVFVGLYAVLLYVKFAETLLNPIGVPVMFILKLCILSVACGSVDV